jgi:nucleoside-diphosphate-sugar epimerase
VKILVLGGTRFIGPPAVRRLVELGHDVTVFHRGQSQAELPAGVQHIYGDRKNLADHAAAFRTLAPAVVLDMRPLGEADGKLLVELFSGLAQRIVAISSVDVYRAYDRFRRADPGPPDPTPLTEDSPLRDKLYPYRDMVQNEEDLMYHYDKILFERVVMNEPSLPATVLRLPMVYGPGDYQHRLFPYLKRMDDGRPAILLAEDYANWQAPRGYVEDLGEAIALCVVKEEAAGRVYHAGDAPSVTETAWIERIAQTTGWSGKIITRANDKLPESLQHNYDTAQSWALDSARIRRELGYGEVTPPSAAMQRTIEWERANPPQQIDPAAFDYAAEDAVLGAVAGDR